MRPRDLFRAPRFEDAESTRVASVLAPLLGAAILATVAIAVSSFAVEWVMPMQIVELAFMIVVLGIARWLVERGRLVAAAWIATSITFLSSTSSLVFDGSAATYPVAYAVTIVIGGMTLGRRAGLSLGIVASILIAVAHAAAVAGVLELRRPIEAHGVIVLQVACLLVLGGVMVWSNRALNRVLAQIKRQEQASRELEQSLLKSQRMESIGRLAGGIAHDFNNLLTVALGNATYLKSSADLDAEQLEAIEAILKACHGGANLTKQLLTFGRRRVVARERLDPADAVADFQLVLDYMAGKHAELVIDCPKGQGAIECDPGQLQHALANLVINAGQAVEGGGRVEISTRAETLVADRASSHGTIPVGDYVVIRVLDSGTGMSSQTISAAFEPFFTTKRDDGGSGLGLAVVHGVVHQNGGYAEIESSPESGTTFSLWFPRVEGEAAWRPVTGSHTATTRLDGTHILLVDDDDEARRGIRLLLEGSGAKVTCFADGADALASSPTTPGRYSLALVDVLMPEMSGPELADALRSEGFSGPIVFLTGYADPDSLRDEIARSATVLYKPIGGADLSRALVQALTDDAPEQATAS